MIDIEKAAELINRAIAMDLWSLTDHTKVTRQEFLDAIARIHQQAQEREGEIARLRGLVAEVVDCGYLEFGPMKAAALHAKLTAEAKPEPEDCDHPEPPAPVTCRKALLDQIIQDATAPYPCSTGDVLLAIKGRCWAALATPCECAGLREELEREERAFRAWRTETRQLRAELAERAERAEKTRSLAQEASVRDLEAKRLAESQVSMFANGYARFEQAERQRDTARAGWKEAVESLRQASGTALRGYGSTRAFIDENVPDWVHGDDGPIYWAMRLHQGLAAIVARFDAQGGGR